MIGDINKGKILSRYNIGSTGSSSWEYAKIYSKTLNFWKTCFAVWGTEWSLLSSSERKL